ncbi:MAG TPA: F0F1 ATP synthase subunit B [Dehalococcoidia bacterium]|nr:F0F1 ATP synthase subunit B [Dehalococcoidia bacterium]
MSKAFDALGLNIGTLLAFIINFGILLFLLKQFLYGPVLKMLDERRQRIQEALAAADRAAESARESETRVQEQIRQGQIQAQEIVANAQQIAQRIQDDATRQGQERQQQLVTQAQATIRQESEAARADLRREFADLTILAAEKVINQSLDRQAHLRLINEVLESSAGRNGSQN